jgi:hypothetical protein
MTLLDVANTPQENDKVCESSINLSTDSLRDTELRFHEKCDELDSLEQRYAQDLSDVKFKLRGKCDEHDALEKRYAQDLGDVRSELKGKCDELDALEKRYAQDLGDVRSELKGKCDELDALEQRHAQELYATIDSKNNTIRDLEIRLAQSTETINLLVKRDIDKEKELLEKESQVLSQMQNRLCACK